jgi:tetratricopeptide (TPR) repeat protein
MRRSEVEWIQASSAIWSEAKRLYINLSLVLVAEIGGLFLLATLLHKGFFWLSQYWADSRRSLQPQEEQGLDCIYRDQGGMNKVAEMYRRVLKGRDHTSTLATVINLGLLYKGQGELDKAEELFQRVIEGYEKIFGRDYTLTLATVNNLGNLYRDQGKSDKAAEVYQQALEGYEKAFGCNHTLTLATINNLGNLYRDQGRLDKAEEMFQRALEGETGRILDAVTPRRRFPWSRT